jgi:succinate dehydrogenase flavin-adding protein (antitoxin of CptAB toxin-antitoxin module)
MHPITHIENKTSSRRKRFTKEEDKQLIEFVQMFGEMNWKFISIFMENRNPRQCRDRWELFLSPTLKQSEWTKEEDELLIVIKKKFGSQWRFIKDFFPDRTDVSIKNRWKYLQKVGKLREDNSFRKDTHVNFQSITSEDQIENDNLFNFSDNDFLYDFE